MGEHKLVAAARTFLYANARLIDRRRFEYHFEGGPKQAVIDALKLYQNRDGGFGNALEPDIRCPDSQPVPTEMALQIMDEIELFDPGIVSGIARYLRAIALPGGGFPLVFRSAGNYPQAPWWKAEQDDAPSINPTGTILGLLRKQNAETSFYHESWFRDSEAYAWRVVGNGGELPHGYHDGVQWATFLEHAEDQARAALHRPAFDAWLLSPGTIELDPHAGGYVQKALDWAPTKDSYAAKRIADADVRRHLDALVASQQEDGGWPMSWPAVAPGAEAEWRGWITVNRLLTLKSYGIIG